MASFAPAASAETASAPARRRPRPAARPHVAGSIAWIAIAGIVLAGVVFLNVAVLRLNLRLDDLGRERVRLHAQNATLASQLSGAANSLKIEAQARKLLGLQPAEDVSYLDLSK